MCPRLIQVHALQLQSFCTRNYWHARAFLLRRFAVLAEVTELYPDMEATDEPITTLSDNTVSVMSTCSFGYSSHTN